MQEQEEVNMGWGAWERILGGKRLAQGGGQVRRGRESSTVASQGSPGAAAAEAGAGALRASARANPDLGHLTS
jgi:hypothetical protein